jgi:hypothetical protein
MKKIKFECFRGMLSSWEKLFQEAASFAEKLKREQLISISHSCDHSEAVVTVWYWSS